MTRAAEAEATAALLALVTVAVGDDEPLFVELAAELADSTAAGGPGAVRDLVGGAVALLVELVLGFSSPPAVVLSTIGQELAGIRADPTY